MFKNLNPGAIGIKASLAEGIQLAKAAGFGGLDLNIGEAAKLSEEKSIAYVKGLYEEADIKPGGWGLPVNIRGDESDYQNGLEQLPKLAEIGQAIGCTRVPTWILSFSDDLPFQENFDFHLKRLKPVAEALRDHGCQLGLEFLGPKTIRDGHTYEFIHTLPAMLELCDRIGTGNVGLLLDAWHWYTSYGTLDELRELSADQVVYVHINDAPANTPIDEQIDNIRCLPGETGVIDLNGFLKCLNEIGYEGPVTPEPFSKEVNAMEASEAARVTGESLSKVWREAGLE